MKRPGLLEWFLDVFRGLMTEPEDHAVDRARNVGRIFQPATNRSLHPCPRFLRRAQNSIAAAMIHDDAVFRIAQDQGTIDVLAREISAHVELARIARTIDRLRGAEEFDLVTELDVVPPSHEQLRAAPGRFAIDLD